METFTFNFLIIFPIEIITLDNKIFTLFNNQAMILTAGSNSTLLNLFPIECFLILIFNGDSFSRIKSISKLIRCLLIMYWYNSGDDVELVTIVSRNQKQFQTLNQFLATSVLSFEINESNNLYTSYAGPYLTLFKINILKNLLIDALYSFQLWKRRLNILSKSLAYFKKTSYPGLHFENCQIKAPAQLEDDDILSKT